MGAFLGQSHFKGGKTKAHIGKKEIALNELAMIRNDAGPLSPKLHSPSVFLVMVFSHCAQQGWPGSERGCQLLRCPHLPGMEWAFDTHYFICILLLKKSKFREAKYSIELHEIDYISSSLSNKNCELISPGLHTGKWPSHGVPPEPFPTHGSLPICRLQAPRALTPACRLGLLPLSPPLSWCCLPAFILRLTSGLLPSTLGNASPSLLTSVFSDLSSLWFGTFCLSSDLWPSLWLFFIHQDSCAHTEPLLPTLVRTAFHFSYLSFSRSGGF